MLHSSVLSILALTFAATTQAKLSPDNTCGGHKGYTCNPALTQGGPCCSSSGYCGASHAYCGTGCQSAFGNCTIPTSSSLATSTKKAKTTMSTSTTSPKSTACSIYILPDVGTFTHSANYTFLTSTLPSGLSISTYPVGNPPYTHLFATSNIALTPPYLSLSVPGGQTTFPISSAQIATTASNILHASVRTTAILSAEPGTCQSSFFYRSDSQEIDIEFLSNRSASSNALNSLPNQGGASSWTNAQRKRLPLHYTNQAVSNAAPETTAFGPSPVGWDDEEHEYRVDWVAGEVSFWVDGVRQDVFDSNVPTQAGSWLWSNWANGNPGWTTGPPVKNSVFRIRAIEMYYNTTSSGC